MLGATLRQVSKVNRTRFCARCDLHVDLILACIHSSVSVSVHSTMQWAQENTLDFIYTTRCLFCWTRTIQNIITNYTSMALGRGQHRLWEQFPKNAASRWSLLLSFRRERGRKWKQPTTGGSKREPSCPKLHLEASRIPKGVTNYSVTFCSKTPMLAVIRATYGVRSSPVGLSVTRHFTIARTQQQLLIKIMTTRS